MISLILGLFALSIPLFIFFRLNKKQNKHLDFYSFVSMTLVAFAITAQIFAVYKLTQIEDWAGIDDTSGVAAYASLALLIVTLLLNTINYFKARKQRKLNHLKK